jgi:hypothetical protein
MEGITGEVTAKIMTFQDMTDCFKRSGLLQMALYFIAALGGLIVDFAVYISLIRLVSIHYLVAGVPGL